MAPSESAASLLTWKRLAAKTFTVEWETTEEGAHLNQSIKQTNNQSPFFKNISKSLAQWQRKTNRSLQTVLGKIYQREETLSRTRVWKSVVYVERLGRENNTNISYDQEIEIRSDWQTSHSELNTSTAVERIWTDTGNYCDMDVPKIDYKCKIIP